MNKWTTEDLQDTENILYYNIMMDTYHYTFVQTHKTLSWLSCKLWTLNVSNLSMLAHLC